jgi:hypothetical protein
MTTLDRFTPSKAPVKRVKSIQLGVWDPDEIVSSRSPGSAVAGGVACRAHDAATNWTGIQRRKSIQCAMWRLPSCLRRASPKQEDSVTPAWAPWTSSVAFALQTAPICMTALAILVTLSWLSLFITVRVPERGKQQNHKFGICCPCCSCQQAIQSNAGSLEFLRVGSLFTSIAITLSYAVFTPALSPKLGHATDLSVHCRC